MASTELIFVSYRRSDTEGYAGRLTDSLEAYFGAGRVFRDVGGITGGEDFQHRIREGIAGAGAVIVLIGPNWLSRTGDDKPRLHDPEDHLATEIAEALEQKRLVVPVLVQGARMPVEEDLPERLRDLVKRNAVSVSDEGWRLDVIRLAKVLSLDISGSVAERRLELFQRGVLTVLAVPLVLGLYWLGYGRFPEPPVVANFVTIVPVVVVFLALMATLRWFHPAKRRFVWTALFVGVPSAVAVIVKYTYMRPPTGVDAPQQIDLMRSEEAIAETCIIIALVLVLVCLTGFRPTDESY